MCLPVGRHDRQVGAAQRRAQEARAKRAASRQDPPRECLQLLIMRYPHLEGCIKTTNYNVPNEVDINEDLEAAQLLLELRSFQPVQGPLAERKQTQDQALQVSTCTTPVLDQRLSDLLTTNAAVKAYTGVESTALLDAIVRCTERIDSQKSELTVRERVILVLIKMKTNLSFACLAIIFKVSKTSISRYFHSTLQTLSRVMKAALPWPSTEEVANNLPKCFQSFSNVRVVLDGTEIEVEKARCLACRIWTYSHYKGTHTRRSFWLVFLPRDSSLF
ncbi:unnamed protein product [Ixodes hexagonus]